MNEINVVIKRGEWALNVAGFMDFSNNNKIYYNIMCNLIIILIMI